jgi:hypothetical protein
MKLNGTRHFRTHAEDVKTLGENIDTIRKNTEAVLDAGKEFGLEAN